MVYRLYGEVVQECESCQKFVQAPQRSRITGMRAIQFGGLWFTDHVELVIQKLTYLILVTTDAATNLLRDGCQNTKYHAETI